MALQPETEEVATFYAKMLEHDYTTKEVFNQNFFKDWRKVKLAKCCGKKDSWPVWSCGSDKVNCCFTDKVKKMLHDWWLCKDE